MQRLYKVTEPEALIDNLEQVRAIFQDQVESLMHRAQDGEPLGMEQEMRFIAFEAYSERLDALINSLSERVHVAKHLYPSEPPTVSLLSDDERLAVNALSVNALDLSLFGSAIYGKE